MAIFTWFKKKEPEDDEQVLASLSEDIKKRQTRLAEIRLRERRTTLLITLYTLSIWAAYIAAWWVGWRPLRAFPIVAGPIIIQFSRRIAQTWYARIGNAEEKTLKELLSKQRNKIEEIKKKTNYYTTKDLLERYDSPSTANSPARPGRPDMPPNQGQGRPSQQLVTPQRGPLGQTNGYPQVNRGQAPNMPVLGSRPPQLPLTPQRRQWFDRLADALLGDDEVGANSPKSRYALICQKCFAHNGLVKEELWEDTQYVCPKCGSFNPSVRALKGGYAATSPQHGSNSLVQAQRRAAPRMSAPGASGGSALLLAEEISYDRRHSMPAPSVATLTDEEDEDEDQQSPAESKTGKRRPPLSPTVSLPDGEKYENEEQESEPEIEKVQGGSPGRRRMLIVVDDN